MIPGRHRLRRGDATSAADRRQQVAGMDLERLKTETSRLLRELASETDWATELIQTRRRGLGFLTAEQAAARDALIRTERRIRHERESAGEPVGQGATPAPANINAISVLAAVDTDLHRIVAGVTAAWEAVGISLLRRLPVDAPLGSVIEHVRALAMDIPTESPLRHIVARLDANLDDVRTFIDGDDRTFLGGPCPWCGHDSLVIYWTRDGIRDAFTARCEKHPKQRYLDPCICNDITCACKADPIAHRHEWHLDAIPTSRDSWDHLGRHLAHDRTGADTTDLRTATLRLGQPRPTHRQEPR